MQAQAIPQLIERAKGRGFSVPDLGRLMAADASEERRAVVGPWCLLMFADETHARSALGDTGFETANTGELTDPDLDGHEFVRPRGLWVFPLAPDRTRWTLGRDASCDVVLAHPLVSRRHAEVAIHGHGLVVRDLNSRNGTRKGGVLVDAKEGAFLGPGESFVIGPSRIAPQATAVIQELARRLL